MATARDRADAGSELARTYVVPLDGSPFAERALPVASAIAERVGGRMLLVSAPFRGPLAPGDYLAEVAARFTRVPVDTIVDHEHVPADAIVKVMQETDDRIVCMTSHGRGRLRWSMVGSTAEEVVRRADRPVLLVGRHCRDDFLTRGTHLLACVDGIENSTPIAQCAREWADGLGLRTDAAVVVNPRDVESVVHPDALLDPIVDCFGGSDQVRAHLLTSSYVAGALADLACDLPAAIVAVNCHSRSGLARIALGSVTTAVLNLADCPLLVTRVTSSEER